MDLNRDIWRMQGIVVFDDAGKDVPIIAKADTPINEEVTEFNERDALVRCFIIPSWYSLVRLLDSKVPCAPEF